MTDTTSTRPQATERARSSTVEPSAHNELVSGSNPDERTTPHSLTEAGNVEERAREIAHNIVGFTRERGSAAGAGYRYSRDEVEGYTTKFILQALSQSPPHACCEAMREAAAKIIEGETVHHRYRQWPWFGDGNEDKEQPRVKFCDAAAKAIRALPLPVSADGRDAKPFQCAYNDKGLHRCTAYPLGESGYFGCRTVGCPKFPTASSTAQALNPQQPSTTPEAFGVQPRSHRMSEGEK